MNDNTSKNLYEFATYFKRILQINILSIIIGFIAGVIIVFAPEFLLVLGVILFIIAILLIVFRVLMFIRLLSAKNSSSHPELIKAFNFMLVSLILAIINGIITGVTYFDLSLGFFVGLSIFSSLLSVGGLICDLLQWQSLGKYIAVYGQEKGMSQGFQMVADGIKTYIITVSIVIVCNALNILVLFIPNGIFLVAIVLLIASIVMLAAQFKIANGMLLIFGSIPPVQTSFQYGTPPPSFQQVSGSEEKYCTKCGAKLIPGAKFCTSCGNTL